MRRNHLIPITNHCWLVVSNYPSEKYEFVSWDNDIPNWKVIIHSCSKAPAIKRRACLPSFNQLVIRIFILEVSQIVFLPIPVPDSSQIKQISFVLQRHISHHPHARSSPCHHGRRSTLIFGLSPVVKRQISGKYRQLMSAPFLTPQMEIDRFQKSDF